jgi:hypothetical protein
MKTQTGILLGSFTLLAGIANAQLYSTSFETSQGYTSGVSAAGIDGWAAGSGSGSGQTASTDYASAGTQSLKFTYTGGTFASVRHALPTFGANAVTISSDIYVPSGNGADRLFGLYLSSSATGTLGSTVLGLSIGSNGAVRAGKTWSATYGAATIGTAATGSFADRWLNISLTFDPATFVGTTTISGFGAGQSAITSSFTAVTAPLNINVDADYLTSASAAGTAYFDNLSVSAVPEPASMAALGLGVAALLRKKRK